jgi:hypothetical protein
VLTFKRSGSSCCLRTTQTVRAPLVDSSRGGFQPAFHGVLHVFLFAFLSIHLAVCFWLQKVWRTVREERSDSPRDADGPWVEDGQSGFRDAVLEVRVAFSDGLPCTCERSARPPRTVRRLHADGPPQAMQIA